jgi:hypothetical protein
MYPHLPGPSFVSLSETYNFSSSAPFHRRRVMGLTCFSCPSFLETIYTFAPLFTSAEAIISPIPDPPPETSAIFEATEKRVGMARELLLLEFAMML